MYEMQLKQPFPEITNKGQLKKKMTKDLCHSNLALTKFPDTCGRHGLIFNIVFPVYDTNLWLSFERRKPFPPRLDSASK